MTTHDHEPGDLDDAGEALSPDDGPRDDPAAELVARAREACVEHPELVELLDRVDRLEQLDLQHRPQELDAVHQGLREALTNAGRPDSAS